MRLGSLAELRQNARSRGVAQDSVARAYHAVIEALIDALRLVPQRTTTWYPTVRVDYNLSDSLRFNAVQLSEQKLVQGTPQQLVERASNFGYLSELKRQFPRAS